MFKAFVTHNLLTPADLAVLALKSQHSPIKEFKKGTAFCTLRSAIFFARFKDTLLKHNKGSTLPTDS